MATVFGQIRDFFRAPRLDEALGDLAPKQVQPQTRTSWVFDSHVMTEASSVRGGKNPQAVSLAWDEDRWNIDSSAKSSWTGLTHRERKETLLQIFLANPWASNCIDTIALYIISGGMTIEPRVPNPDKSQRTKIEGLLLRINEDWDFNQYVYDMLTDEMIFGETFGEYTMASGVPYQLFSTDCITMDTEHDRFGRVIRYKQQLTSTSEVNYLDKNKIIRWWNPHKRAKVDPFSPLERIQDAILLDKKMVNWTTTFFQKGAKFPYSIEFQGDKDEADRFLVWYKQNYTGEKNAHLPPVTYNGAKINPSGKGSIDIDFDRGLDRQQMIVLSAFHVPPSIACIAESGNRLTDMSDGQRKILQYIACDPRRHQFFEKFNYRLIRPYFGEDYYVSTRYADFRDDKSLAEVADIRVKNGTLTQNEVRQEMGKEAYVKGGDIPVIITPKEVTPVPRLDDLENEQRTTAKQALDAGELNNEMLKAKVEQAKNPPPPPMIPGQQGATNNEPTTKSGAQKNVGKTAKESLTQEYNQNHGANGRFTTGSDAHTVVGKDGSRSLGPAHPNYTGNSLIGKSAEDKSRALTRNQADWEENLTSEQRKAITAYTGTKFCYQANGGLRQGKKLAPATQAKVNALNASLTATHAPADMQVMRGVGSEVLSQFQVGGTFTDKGFVSTSLSAMTAGAGPFAQEYGAFMRITIPKGTPGAYVADMSRFPQELEYLLPSNSSFRVNKISKDSSGTHTVDITYLGRGGTESFLNLDAGLLLEEADGEDTRKVRPERFIWQPGDIEIHPPIAASGEVGEQVSPADEQLAIEAQMKQAILAHLHGDMSADELTERIAALYAQAAQHGRELATEQVKEKK